MKSKKCNLRISSFLISAVIIMLALTSAALSEAGEREDCNVCGMWIDPYMKTRHVISLKNGSEASFCSISCTAKYIDRHSAEIESVFAADYLSEELINAGDAFYLSGSDGRGS